MYEKFLALLEERGVTVAEVSRQTGIPFSTLSMWKSRRDTNAKLSLDNAAKLARYFGVSLEEFLDEG